MLKNKTTVSIKPVMFGVILMIIVLSAPLAGLVSAQTNTGPTFDESASVTRSVNEYTPSGQNVGAPVEATDPEGDDLTYSLIGSNTSAFQIDSATGQIKTMAPLRHATRSSYGLVVAVTDCKDDNGASEGSNCGIDASITVTVIVIDLPEAPANLSATPGTNSVRLSWDDPSDNSIMRYEVQVSPGERTLTGYASEEDYSGTSVALHGDTMVVGGESDDGNGINVGAAYVFVKSADVWRKAAKLTASDGAAGDWFGNSVAVDGDTVVIGANREDGDDGSGGIVQSGSAYVFVKPVTGWTDVTETAKLTASDGATNDHLGSDVAVSGATVVVGAPQDDTGNGTDAGSVYVFVKPSTGWTDTTETAKLTASDGAAGDSFGNSLTADGDTIVVGAVLDDGNGINAGAAYVFTKSSSGWQQAAKLTTSHRVAGVNFGHDVAMDGDTIVVGAILDHGAGSRTGSAYVFTKSANGWQQTAKLTASDGKAHHSFGHSVAIDGPTVVVGAIFDYPICCKPGSAYIYIKPNEGWADTTETLKRTAPDAAFEDYFGYSVAISGGTMVVGAPSVYGNSGSVCIFVDPPSGWQQTTKLTASDGAAGDQMGESVAVSGDTIVVGAHRDDTSGGSDTGSAYVSIRSASGWQRAAKLTASDGAADDRFGTDVTVEGTIVAVGAPWDDTTNGSNSGSAYLFVKPSTGWTDATETVKLTASDGAADDGFGYSLAISREHNGGRGPRGQRQR